MTSGTEICGIKKTSIFRKHNASEMQFANLGRSGEGGPGRRFAYCKVEGHKRPGIIYVPGYFAPMTVAKANLMEEFCYKTGRPFVKYDSEGVGQSRIAADVEISFTRWYEDACYVVEHLTTGPQMLVCSSNGGWMGFLLAVKYPDRIHSMVLIGPAVNQCLDEDVYEQIVQSLDKETADRVRAGKPMRFKANWIGEVTASKKFLDEMKSREISKEQLSSIKCPIRIIHALDDSSVHWNNSLQLMEAIGHDGVRLCLKNHGNHRLMSDEDLTLQLGCVEELIAKYPEPDAPLQPLPIGMAAQPESLRSSNVDGRAGAKSKL